MSSLLQDVRLALRQFRRSPGWFVVALLTLALGVGANTVAFSLLYGSLFRSLPFPAGDRLVLLQVVRHNADGSTERFPWTFEQYRWLAREPLPLAGAALYNVAGANVSGDGDAERVTLEVVTAGYFEMLGVGAALGRVFTPAEDSIPRAHAVTVVSDGLWRRRFGADPDVIGRTIRANGVTLEIVGVMPPGFSGVSGSAELWIPQMMAPAVTFERQLTSNDPFLWLVGRLPPDVRREQAMTQLAALGPALQAAVPAAESALGATSLEVEARSLAGAGIEQDRRHSALLLFGAVWLVLAVACVNLIALQLARSHTRTREFAVRSALGCGRGRLARQMLTEVGVLAILGSLASAVLTQLVLVLIRRIEPVRLPGPTNLYAAVSEFATLRLEPVVLGFALLVAVLTVLVVSLLPVRHAIRRNAMADLRTGTLQGESGLTLRRPGKLAILTAAEIAFSLALAVSAGLLLRSFVRIRAVDPGFDARNVVAFRMHPLDASFSASAAPALITPVLERVRQVPGVEAATVSMCTPYMATCGRTWLSVASRPRTGPPPLTGVHYVSGDHFRTLGVPLLRGRTFTTADRTGAPRVAIISETAAARFWPDADPIGARIALGDTSHLAQSDSLWEVVGVVGDVVYWPPDQPPGADVYLPYTQFTYASTFVIAKTRTTPAALLPAIRQAVRDVDPDLPLTDVLTLEERADRALSARRFAAVVLLGFALVALALAAAGVYGVASWTVSRRTREIGIRMALGASPTGVCRMLVAEAAVVAAVGVAAGTMLTLAFSGTLRASLYGVSETDPSTFLLAALAVTAATILATAIPALRATRVQPTSALRSD